MIPVSASMYVCRQVLPTFACTGRLLLGSRRENLRCCTAPTPSCTRIKTLLASAFPAESGTRRRSNTWCKRHVHVMFQVTSVVRWRESWDLKSENTSTIMQEMQLVFQPLMHHRCHAADLAVGSNAGNGDRRAKPAPFTGQELRGKLRTVIPQLKHPRL